MSSRNTELSFRLTGDAKSLIDSLERSREAALRTYGTMRRGMEDAKQAWSSAQANVRNLAVELRATEAPAASQRVAFDAAVKKADELKAAYLRVRDGAHEQQQKLRDNAIAIDAARTAQVAMDQQSRSLGARWAALREQSKGLATDTLSLGDAMRTVAITAGGAVGVGSLRELAGLVDQYAALNSRVKLAVSTNAEFVAGQAGVQRIAALNGQELAAVGSLYVRTSGAVRQYGMTQETALKVTDLVGKSIRLSGSTVQEAASANLQFAQALGAGTLRGEELNSVLEAAPRLAQALADGLGVPQTKLKQLGEQGALTSQQIINALLSQEQRLNAESALAPLRLSEAWKTFGNEVELYVGKADQAAGTSAALANGIRLMSENVNILLPGIAALGAGLTAVAATSATRALAGLVVASGPVGITIGVATAAAVGLWAALANGSERAVPGAEKALKGLTKEVIEFSDRMTDAQRKQSATDLEAALERLRDAYSQMSRETPNAPILKRWAEEIAEAEKAMDRLLAKATKQPLPFTLEKASLGLGGLAPAQGQLIDKKQADALDAFDKAYGAFVERTVDGEGKLVFSYGQIKTALDNMLSSAKSPAELNALIAGLETAQKKGDSPALNSALATAVEARTAAETKALNERVSGLKTDADRAAAAFGVTAEQARLSMQLATSLSRVTAELREDSRALSEDQAASVRADVAQATAQASVQIGLAQQVSDKKRALIISERDAAIGAAKAVSDMAEQAESKRFEAIRKSRAALEEQRQSLLATQQAMIAAGNTSQAEKVAGDLEKIAAQEQNLATQQTALLDGGLERRKRTSEEVVRLEESATRQITEVERAAAQERLGLQRKAQSDIVAKTNDALSAYKSYAQKVIELDRQIASSRLDTASSIAELKRKDMSPTQQVGSLRSEMDSLKRESQDAANAGDRQRQQDALNRQKSVAGALANVQGDGVDPKAMRQEAIANLQRIGEESAQVLEAQKGEAQAAANQQLQTFQEMLVVLKQMAAAIALINGGPTIKVGADVDRQAAEKAGTELQNSFANLSYSVKIKPEIDQSAKVSVIKDLRDIGSNSGSFWDQSEPIYGFRAGQRDAGDTSNQVGIIRMATGGLLQGPGHDTSDNILTLTSPGEFVVRAAAVRHYGADTIAALNRMRLPRFAQGGLVGGLSIPSPIAQPAVPAALQPMNLSFPGKQSFSVQAEPDIAKAMERFLRKEILMRGRM